MATINLRSATADDADVVHAWRSEPSSGRFQPVLPLPVDTVRMMLGDRETGRAGPESFGKFQWIIEATVNRPGG